MKAEFITALSALGGSLANCNVSESEAYKIALNFSIRISRGYVDDMLPEQELGAKYVMRIYFSTHYRETDDPIYLEKIKELNAPYPHELELL